MSTLKIIFLFKMLLIIFIAPRNSAYVKFSPEEQGYIDEMHIFFYEATATKSTYRIMPPRYSSSHISTIFSEDAEVDDWVGINDYYPNKLLPKIERMIPPKIFIKVHSIAIEIMKLRIIQAKKFGVYAYRVGLEAPEFQLIDAQIKIKRIEMNKEIENILLDVDERDDNELYSKNDIFLTFEPIIFPIEIGLTNDGNFTLSPVAKIPTGFGDIGLNPDNNRGVKKIIVIYKNKRKAFSLDRKFKIFIPSKYGFNLISENEEILIIEVLSKPN